MLPRYAPVCEIAAIVALIGKKVAAGNTVEAFRNSRRIPPGVRTRFT
jgi:hypothetical protein